MTKKQVFRCIAFVLVVGMMLVVLCDLFELNNTSNYDKRYTTFRKLEKTPLMPFILVQAVLTDTGFHLKPMKNTE